MIVLAVETSCDETSVAIVSSGEVLSNQVASQIRLHSAYGGVVPELATREHLRNLLPVAREALSEAGLKIREVEIVAGTQGPGLPPALWVGFQAAQSLAFALRKPFLGIHHHEAHLYSPWIQAIGDAAARSPAPFEPSISLIVSGGHTLLVHVRSLFDHQVIGSTQDDAAGECFDKVAKLIGLGYPGGPELDRLAELGNPATYPFPRPMMHEPNDDFSFSGLKTAVRYYVKDHPEVLDSIEAIQDLCASVRAAIVDVLVSKTIRAASRLGLDWVTASGGVTCNRQLRRQLERECQKRHLKLRLADPTFCTDNAAMVGILAERKWLAGTEPTSLDAEIRPNWPLTGFSNLIAS